MVYFILILISAIAKGMADKIRFQPSLFWWKTDWWLGKGNYAWNKRTFLTKYIFSFLADGWHLMDSVRVLCLIITVVLALQWEWWNVIILYVIHGIAFETIYGTNNKK